ncbi:hypothetical protein F2Q70_00036679 [Brassica cretica]|uniref:Uncharacterized protein n=1 Tax=Brassica cretica TaxID=69181 RepID=A0A8S9JU20_BRACR|nr:hypothetical protein F2Q70_00036679 [Brassica cretica]
MRSVFHHTIVTDLQNKRQGTASTLTCGEVRGGRIKPRGRYMKIFVPKKLTDHDGEKVSLIKLATWIEVPARDNRSHVFARRSSHHKRKLKMSTLASRSVNSSA